ncbi:hypothetical protein ABTE83_19960, partial [Acinetobacter baumannii]
VVVDTPEGGHRLICKGAVEEMLAISARVRRDGEDVPLDQAERKRMAALARSWNEDGFRVLVVATRDIPANDARQHYTT